ncbi:hypothetical protein JWG45_01845 [Leptospira sp. 201903070]|uniref:Uncharacterized protein n=1 Tax=Leptospira ainlahdjerensis TaxID=2810033 RepID=A0ABS2UAC9_9LEPT|nr:hypothetical protein [Leptospira ainlahdjerensis]MBM9575885.1 hypothetical protein [Leptospira ainlahdjerensis]
MENKQKYNTINKNDQDDRLIASRALLSFDDIQKIYEFDGSEKITKRSGKFLHLSRYKNLNISGFLLTWR